MKIWTMGAGKALLTLNHVQSAGKAPQRQPGRHQTMIGCLARVQRFAHRTEHGLQSSRLGARYTQRGDKFLLIETQQMRARRGRAKAADRGGRMKTKYVVMARREHPADTALE